jgi:signal peptidase I
MEPLERNEFGVAELSATAAEIAPVEEASSRSGDRSFWFDLRVWARDIALSVAIAAIVIVFLYQPVKVEGTSMMPWLQDQERIFVNKFVYRFEEIHRGDIVVFRFPLDPTKSYIKRVVGLPGDEVEMRDGVVLINEQVVPEPYVEPSYRDRSTYPRQKVPPGHYFVLGDHRNTSNDSRTWGTVERGYIAGKAVFAYWPLDRFGVLQ